MFVCLRLSPRFHGQLRHRLDCFEGVMLSQWLQKKKKRVFRCQPVGLAIYRTSVRIIKHPAIKVPSFNSKMLFRERLVGCFFPCFTR